MNRQDYKYAALREDQYEAILAEGEKAFGIKSPLHGHDNWAAVDNEVQAENVDLRVLLAALLLEDHFGTDPNGGVELARVYNFGGIKWAGQDGAYNSGIQVPANEQPGTYAGFYNFGGFIKELIRTLNNVYCGPAFKSGDLALAWAIYVGGPNNPNMVAGQNRVDQWQYYLKKYPPEGGTPVPDGIYGEDLLAIGARHVGEEASDGTLDPWNPVGHLWEGWCQAFTHGVRSTAGLQVVPHASAAEQLDAVVAQGLLQYGEPEHGAVILWGRSFDPQGHTCFWDADRHQFLSTLYSPSRIGYYYSATWYNAMAGWWRPPGVAGPRRGVQPPTPVPPVDTWFIDDNPYGKVPIKMPFWARWDEINTMGTPLDHPGSINPNGRALQSFGYAVQPEQTLPTGRRIQQFERAVLAVNPTEVAPWDVVSLLMSEAIALGVNIK